ncbi:MAG: hypothetical protein GPJ50_04040 [Candidatus Heimdallarchaeota archaeon]|nr:hypothetical protein [Candidatus Heimdallarchaeota archaeon]
MMEETSEVKLIHKIVDILGGGALGAVIILGYLFLSVGVVLLLLFIIKLLHQLIVGA